MNAAICLSPIRCAGFALALVYTFIASAAVHAEESPAWKKALQPLGEAWKKTPQTFVLNNGADPESLDPAMITGLLDGRIVSALFEGLVQLDPKTLVPRPALAKSWDISDDAITYTFHLRKGLQWSDGTPLTAADFLASWERVLNPATGADYANQLFPVKNAKAYHKKEITDFSQVGITAINAQTLRVTLTQPCPYFLDLVAFETLYAVPLKQIKKHGKSWTKPEHIISSGAFVLHEWKPRERIVLVKNKRYWDRDFVKLTRVTVLPYDDLNTAYQLYQQGKIQWMPGIPLPRLDEIKRHPDYYRMKFLGTYFYRLNTTKPPFDDVRVRKAFSIAINRRVITEQVLRAGQEPATWFCPSVGGYTPVKGLAYDRDAARELIAQTKYKKGGVPFPKIDILYNNSESHKLVAETIAQQWREAFGVTISLQNTEWKTYLPKMERMDFMICRSSWIGDYGDPNTFFDMFTSGSRLNRTGWKSPAYDKLLEASQRERDTTKRMKLFREMETLLVEKEFPFIPIYIYVNQGLLHESVNGWYGNIRDLHPLKYIWREDIAE